MKTYIMRWNPGISSYKKETYIQNRENFPEGFMMDWSIYEWEDAKEGDEYYMVRVGDGPTGIVFRGEFLSDPYLGEDWAGSAKKRYYVDMSVEYHTDPDKPTLTIEELQAAMPEIVWQPGHSGQLITEEQAEKLDKLWSVAFHK